MNIRKIIAGATVALLAGSGLALASVLPASAHDKAADISCSLATVSLTNYDKDAKATVVLDGVTLIDGTFGGKYTLSQKLTNTEDKASHSLVVTVRSNDGAQYNVDFSKTVEGCYTGPKTVTVPQAVPTPPTCEDAGSIPLLATSTGPAQNANGYEFVGQGFRVYVSPAYVGASTYTLTFQKVGAGFDPAFPNGTKVIGNTTQTLTVLPAIGYQTADSTAPCFNRPEVPVKDNLVVVVESAPDCLTDTVAIHTTTTVYTYVWNESTKSFDETATPTTVDTSRPATRDEIVACNPLPEDYSKQGETVTDKVECDVTEAPTHTTFTDYTYSRDEAGHVVEASSTRVVDGTRPLTSDEVVICPIVIPPTPLTPAVTIPLDKLAYTGMDSSALALTGGLGAAGLLAGAVLLGLALRRRKTV